MLAPYWLFALGSLFVLVTLLLPRGIVGTLYHHWPKRRASATQAPAPAPTPSQAPAAAE
jgi:urea transport system permease protein